MITDISPLSKSKNIEFIDASNNNISAVPDFDSESTLQTLLLGKNKINDLSTLHRLASLTYLDLSENLIKNAKNISSLVNLESLVINNNPVTNFDFLNELKKLTLLDVKSTGFMNLTPIKSTAITTIDANDTELASLSGIEQFKELRYLAIANTTVTDIENLATLSKLDYLDISNLEIEDQSPLFSIPGLLTLIAEGQDFTDATFVNKNIEIIS